MSRALCFCSGACLGVAVADWNYVGLIAASIVAMLASILVYMYVENDGGKAS